MDELRGKPWTQSIEYRDHAERTEKARKLYEETLKFDEVEVCKDWTKAEILLKFKQIKAKIKPFADVTPGSEVIYAIAIVWVGFRLYYLYPQHAAILKERGIVSSTAHDGSSHQSMYPLTSTGEPILMNDYCSDLAKPECV